MSSKRHSGIAHRFADLRGCSAVKRAHIHDRDFFMQNLLRFSLRKNSTFDPVIFRVKALQARIAESLGKKLELLDRVNVLT
jgi:hypothetical protein